MLKKFWKGFMIYSYVTLFAYVWSECILQYAQWLKEKLTEAGGGHCKIRLEYMWVTTFRRTKEAFKILCNL